MYNEQKNDERTMEALLGWMTIAITAFVAFKFGKRVERQDHK